MKTAKEIIKEHVIESIMTERKANRDEAELIYEDDHEDTLMMEKHITEMMKAYAEQAIDMCAEDLEYCRYYMDYDKYLSVKQYILNVKNLLK